jgi:hypothetical protein
MSLSRLLLPCPDTVIQLQRLTGGESAAKKWTFVQRIETSELWMSALGQKLTSALQKAMSALPPKADI